MAVANGASEAENHTRWSFPLETSSRNWLHEGNAVVFAEEHSRKDFRGGI